MCRAVLSAFIDNGAWVICMTLPGDTPHLDWRTKVKLTGGVPAIFYLFRGHVISVIFIFFFLKKKNLIE